MPCLRDPSTFQCTKPCSKKLKCGHACPNQCGQRCERKCIEEVRKTWSSCNHTCTTQCHINPAKTMCPKPCNSLLKCEHICTGTCGKCKEGRVHQPCSSKCDRVLFCDHKCRVPCTKNCPACSEKCENKCPHSECQYKCGQPCKKCNEPCQWRCKHLKCTKLCGEVCDRPRCNEPCTKKLKKCGHRCPGLCGEPCPKKCLICDKNELTEIFFGYEDEKGARFLELTDCGHVFEVKGMDGYIDMHEKEKQKGQSTSIQMIKCPRCSKAIRTSLRYGNIVKAILDDFEEVKKTIHSKNASPISTFRAKVEKEVESAALATEFPTETSNIKTKLEKSILTNEDVNVIENQVQFLKFIAKLKNLVKQAESVKCEPLADGSNLSEPDQEIKLMKSELECLLQWVMKDRKRFSEQELEEFDEEVHRSWLMLSYLALSSEIRKRKIKLSEKEVEYMTYVEETLKTGTKLSEQEKNKCTRSIQDVTNNKALGVKYTTVTEREKNTIVKAIGLSKGHWFKCPKGHIYCIGECGGATVEGKCPECGTKIGGKKHRLLSDNRLAPEMDGATHAAWSNRANNMRN